MNNYFIKGFIKDDYIGLNGNISTINHFEREEQDIGTLIYVIIKACKSIEEWTISIRYRNLKSPFVYGITEIDLYKMNEQQLIKTLQYYCNAYLVLHHLSKMSENKLDSRYNCRIDKSLLLQEGGELLDYITKADRECMDKWGRSLFQ